MFLQKVISISVLKVHDENNRIQSRICIYKSKAGIRI